MWVITCGGDASTEDSGPVYRVIGPFSSAEEADNFDNKNRVYGSIFKLDDPKSMKL
jgi:hypothetical protein